MRVIFLVVPDLKLAALRYFSTALNMIPSMTIVTGRKKQNMPPNTVAKALRLMSHKSDEEREKIAEELLAALERGELESLLKE